MVYGPGLGCAAAAIVFTLAQVVLFSREHCACCGAPAPGAAPLAGSTTVTVTVLNSAAMPNPVLAGNPALPPGWTKAGPDEHGDYW